MSDTRQDKQAINQQLRQLPQVEQVLSSPELADAALRWRRDVFKRVVQQEIAAARKELTNGKAAALEPLNIPSRVLHKFEQLDASLIKPVVNATGIVLHTNLGRAVLSPSAQAAVAAVAAGYSNLEVDLETGRRTRRDITLEPLLTALTGADAATVVNNCAAAVYLSLNALASGQEVITSRGELVEIGGSYRVPDVARASGCRLIEVGTTNRTRLSDYAGAITADTALLLKTHPSNYRVRGFTEEVPLDQLCKLGHEHGIPVVVDLGSGWIDVAGEPLMAPGGAGTPARDEEADKSVRPTNAAPTKIPEPSVLETLAGGADLVLFSGDKLLGGPQAGIVVGNRGIIERLRESPLWRALRIDKLTAAALGATLLDHLHGAPGSPTYPGNVLAIASASGSAMSPPPDIGATALRLANAIRAAQPGWQIDLIDAPGSWGGGSLPEEEIASYALTISAADFSADQLDHFMRTGEPAVAGYKLAGTYALNALTLLSGDEQRIIDAIKAIK